MNRGLAGACTQLELGSLLARKPGKDESTHAFVAAAAALALGAAVLSALRLAPG